MADSKIEQKKMFEIRMSIRGRTFPSTHSYHNFNSDLIRIDESKLLLFKENWEYFEDL